MPRKPKSPKPLYKQKPPKGRDAALRRPNGGTPQEAAQRDVPAKNDFVHAKIIPPSHFELREDGSVRTTSTSSQISNPGRGGTHPYQNAEHAPALIYTSDTPFIRLYHGNSLELLDAIAAKYPAGRFDAIFADPPYFLSNGGISCHAGRMVKVDKGDWDTLASLGSGERNSAEQKAEGRANGRERVNSAAYELMHEFNREWLKRCQKVLKPNGTIWITGTHHVIFSIGFAMQQLGYKILNDIAWEKPNPPPNLSCRYFTHSTETILWAAKNEKSRHVFNYQEMRKVTGKQMKTVWRKEELVRARSTASQIPSEKVGDDVEIVPTELNPIWTMTAPSGDEKTFGKHPTQKPVALIERCLLASTNEGDLVLDPFLGGGTTAVAAIKLNRGCVGIELDEAHAKCAAKRIEASIEQHKSELQLRP